MDEAEALKDLEGCSRITTFVRKPILKTTEVPINKKLRIIKAARKKTIFGEKVMLELEENVIFLPSAYNNIKNITVEEINKNNFYVEKIEAGEKYSPSRFKFHSK